MFERVVENWLTKVNERQYQFAFGQVLLSKGYRILHMSSHGPQEQGKDIISIDPTGRPIGFQLKTGNLDLGAFRKIRDEIVELVELPIEFPGVPKNPHHRAVLVTNGRLADTVRSAISGHNQKWLARGFVELELVLFDDLLKDLIELHGRFLPTQLHDVEEFLRLYTFNGRSPLPRKQFSEFIVNNLPLKDSLKSRKGSSRHRKEAVVPSAKELGRNISSTAVLVSYALNAFTSSNNQWALFEGWIMFCAHLLAVAEKFDLPDVCWKETFDIAFLAAKSALKALTHEAVTHEHLIEGDALVDSQVRKARITILVGLMAVHQFISRITGESNELTPHIHRFLKEHRADLWFWGETAVPYLVLLGLYIERMEGSVQAESLWGSLLRAICLRNRYKKESEKSEGLSDPYLEVEDSIAHFHGLDEKPEWERPEYDGHSYCLRALVLMLARRLRRQFLSSSWHEITGVDCSEMFPAPAWTMLLWRSKSGYLKITVPQRPQSWAALLAESQTDDSSQIPARLVSRPEFMAAWITVYAHRLRGDVIQVMEKGLC